MGIKKNSLFIVLFMFLLIVFDAFQQRYYINSFNLTDEPVLLSTLLKSHFTRWLIWGLISIPFGILVWRFLINQKIHSFTSKLLLAAVAVISFLISVFLICLVSIWQQEVALTFTTLQEYFVFFAYQKGLTFFMAYVTMVLLLNNYARSKKVKDQEVEIINLQQASDELNKTLQLKNNQSEPHLTVKTGYKIKPIPLNQIIWIQADDYCVKVHTGNSSYSLRKSLKALEEQLRPFRFIRIHRGALLNLEYIDQINFESATIRLQNASELPLSRSGIRTLKKRIKETSL